MDFFRMIPDSFFSLLSSKNKRIYLACILESFKTYETGSILGIDKKIIVDDLVHFLDENTYLYDVEDEEDEESNPKSKRELANYILRRMEECGWIDIDVTDDYEELLNFTDVAIIICEAFLNAFPRYYWDDSMEEESYEVHANEYQGYIFTIYSLLMNTENTDYAMLFNLVYNYTKQLIRALRRLDSRLKDYISSVVETSEVKDLLERLVSFKPEVYDRSYLKFKTSDNINRYRLSIVLKLSELSANELAMSMIVGDFRHRYPSLELASQKATAAIDEIIDVFNSIDAFVSEIDNKNRTYINSTIGKIKFLLSEDDNVIGKLNRILKYVKDGAKADKLDKSMRLVDSLYDLNQFKLYSAENSLYTPRGNYSRNYNQLSDSIGLDGFELTDEFLNQFKTAYNEVEIDRFLTEHLVDHRLCASQLISYDCPSSQVLMTIYALMYASNLDYTITILENEISHRLYRLKDFIIERRS